MKIQLEDLTKSFPGRGRNSSRVTAVKDFNFKIPDGELIGLLGPSGCGKSTTLNMICGLEKPTSGKIFFGDKDVTALPPEKRGVGMVFQNYALYPHLTVRQNIIFPLQNLKGRTSFLGRRWKKGPWTRRLSCRFRNSWRENPASSPAVSSSVWPSPGRW